MMNTRSKKEQDDTSPHSDTKESPFETLDQEGNLADFVVPDGPPTRKHKRDKTLTPRKSTSMNEMLMTYLIMKATDKANEELTKRRKKSKGKVGKGKGIKDKGKGIKDKGKGIKDKGNKKATKNVSSSPSPSPSPLADSTDIVISCEPTLDIEKEIQMFHGSDCEMSEMSEMSDSEDSVCSTLASIDSYDSSVSIRKQGRITIEEIEVTLQKDSSFGNLSELDGIAEMDEDEDEEDDEEDDEYIPSDHTESDDNFEDCEEDYEKDEEMRVNIHRGETVSESMSETTSETLSEGDISLESDSEESGSDGEDGEESYTYDKYDETYEELLDSHATLNTEERDMEYYHYLEPTKKESLITQTKEIYEVNGSHVPLRFKVIDSHMSMKTKAIAMENLDKLSEMDVSTGEYSKMDHWINGILKIPFGIFKELQIGPSHTPQEKREFLKNSYKTLDNAIYGHKEAKTHILQVLGKWIQNPQSGGNVLAIQGPMGNGKTTLVKEGISKVLDRPFSFIALGGASDSAYFDGHCYTYEGSHWGRIVQILQDSRCMNPVFYFDELDKVSDTQKGEEIIHMLTHLTDASQNSLFQDNYFPGINLDLSKALFIFSYNDESKVNKILKDRMYVIHTKGFKDDDKLQIFRNYLYPEIYTTYDFKDSDIIFTDEILKYIIATYTEKEEGVRNLKRCIESIVSKVNIYALTHSDSEEESVTKDLSFTIDDFKMPLHLTQDHVTKLLTKDTDMSVPFGMYC